MTLQQAYYGDYKRRKQRQRMVLFTGCAGLLLVVILLLGVVHFLKSAPRTVYRSDILTLHYSGEPYAIVNDNNPSFDKTDVSKTGYEKYSPLDIYGRCGPAIACLGLDTMPDEERGPIGMIKPSGWQTVRYDDLIEDKYLYNRCHLIAFALSGENANERNLITGTRYMNKTGMLPFEKKTISYIRNTGNHVMYRVTPVFQGTELVARGVLMEAQSVEDNGKGLSFCVFVFNVQPGIVIDYRTGDSSVAKDRF